MAVTVFCVAVPVPLTTCQSL